MIREEIGLFTSYDAMEECAAELKFLILIWSLALREENGGGATGKTMTSACVCAGGEWGK